MSFRTYIFSFLFKWFWSYVVPFIINHIWIIINTACYIPTNKKMKFLKSPILSFNSLNLLLVGSAFLGVSFSYGNFYLYHFFMLLSSTFWIYSFKQNDFLINLDILKIKYVPTLLIVFFWYVLSTFWTLRVDLGIKYVFYEFR